MQFYRKIIQTNIKILTHFNKNSKETIAPVYLYLFPLILYLSSPAYSKSIESYKRLFSLFSSCSSTTTLTRSWEWNLSTTKFSGVLPPSHCNQSLELTEGNIFSMCGAASARCSVRCANWPSAALLADGGAAAACIRVVLIKECKCPVAAPSQPPHHSRMTKSIGPQPDLGLCAGDFIQKTFGETVEQNVQKKCLMHTSLNVKMSLSSCLWNLFSNSTTQSGHIKT